MVPTARFFILLLQALVPAAPEGGRVLCVVGTGAEARSHVQACQVIDSYREVRVWGRSKAHAEK